MHGASSFSGLARAAGLPVASTVGELVQEDGRSGMPSPRLALCLQAVVPVAVGDGNESLERNSLGDELPCSRRPSQGTHPEETYSGEAETMASLRMRTAFTFGTVGAHGRVDLLHGWTCAFAGPWGTDGPRDHALHVPAYTKLSLAHCGLDGWMKSL